MQTKMATVLSVLVISSCALNVVWAQSQAQIDCAQVFSTATHMSNEDKQTACRLYQSWAGVTQLWAIITDSLERFMANQAFTVDQPDNKHLRFYKRKHEYLRFGRK